MTSIYCTVLISFERYVRICFFCQLRATRLITPENFRAYVIALILGPILFCLPKFFEVETKPHVVEYTERFNCSKLWIFDHDATTLARFHSMMKPEDITELHRLGVVCGKNTQKSQPNETSADPFVPKPGAETTSSYLLEALRKRVMERNRTSALNHFLQGKAKARHKPTNGMANYTIEAEILTLQETELRKNPYYYQVYYVYLNILVNSLVPLGTLLYLNIVTVRTLRQIIVQDEITNSNPPYILKKSVSHDNFEVLMEDSFYPNMRKSHSTNSLNGTEAITRRESINQQPTIPLDPKEVICKYTQGEDHVVLFGVEQRKSLPHRIPMCKKTRQSAQKSAHLSNQIPIPSDSKESHEKTGGQSGGGRPTSKEMAKSNPNISHMRVGGGGRVKRMLSFSDPMSDLLDIGKVIVDSPPDEEAGETFAQCNRKGTRRSTVLTMLEFNNPKESKLSPSPEEHEELLTSHEEADSGSRVCERHLSTSSGSKAKTKEIKPEKTSKDSLNVTEQPTAQRTTSQESKKSSQSFLTIQSGPNIYSAADVAASNRLRRHSRAPPGQHTSSSSTHGQRSSRRGTTVTENGSLGLTLSNNPCGTERSQEKRLTRISIFIVWLFIFCHFWKLIPTCYEVFVSHNGSNHDNWPFSVLVVEHISHLLITFNSAINFLIYLVL
ncbi:hypothetical protein TCAL_16684 [Tigriopus californicus]|uniref:Uncharacterized protein n=2 Tax=Tigriopus californicus TaxID=6832 RepID=A0A553PKG0_TIGCA|nr:hypothetical protein TCAL_16684 [Tigriopus californicus]